jgi:hypothetical protein
MNLLAAYNDLANLIYTTITPKKVNGMGGMWSPDSELISDDLILRSYSGGYQHQIISRKFNFEINENYTNAGGTQVELSKGTETQVEECLKHYNLLDEVQIYIDNI